MIFDSDFIIEPLKGKSPHLISVVKARFEAVAPQANPFNHQSLRQSANFCIIPLTHTLPRAVVVAVKSNIIEEIKRKATISLIGN